MYDEALVRQALNGLHAHWTLLREMAFTTLQIGIQSIQWIRHGI
jgi:hypothetical protein